MGVRVAPASLAHSCLAPVARGRRPRTGPGAGGGRCGSFPGRVEGDSRSWEHMEGVVDSELPLLLFSCPACM